MLGVWFKVHDAGDAQESHAKLFSAQKECESPKRDGDENCPAEAPPTGPALERKAEIGVAHQRKPSPVKWMCRCPLTLHGMAGGFESRPGGRSRSEPSVEGQHEISGSTIIDRPERGHHGCGAGAQEG